MRQDHKKRISKDYIDPYGTVTVYNNWIFYNSYTMNKIKTDGSGRKKLFKNNIDVADFSVSGTWLYYIDYDKGLYKIKHNGKSKKELKKAVNYNPVKYQMDGFIIQLQAATSIE